DDAALVLHVLVRVEEAVGRLEARDAAELDLLAERAGETLYVLVDRDAFERLLGDVAVAFGDDEARDAVERTPEDVTLRDEVGLAVELDDRADIAVDRDLDRAFVRVASGALGGAGQALLAQPVLGRVHIAVRLLERALAVHH